VFVGHDSGLSHLAAALRRPTVAIFGLTDPEIWKPRGERVTVVPMVRRHEGSHEHGPTRNTSPIGCSDLRQVLEAVQHWLSGETARQNPSDRSAQS
jgi:ADP-heptose:LPS heptosyltransferase